MSSVENNASDDGMARPPSELISQNQLTGNEEKIEKDDIVSHQKDNIVSHQKDNIVSHQLKVSEEPQPADAKEPPSSHASSSSNNDVNKNEVEKTNDKIILTKEKEKNVGSEPVQATRVQTLIQSKSQNGKQLPSIELTSNSPVNEFLSTGMENEASFCGSSGSSSISRKSSGRDKGELWEEDKIESIDGTGATGSTATPRKLRTVHKPPSKPRISVEALGPLIVDRTELQSPIKLEMEVPEVALKITHSILEERKNHQKSSSSSVFTQKLSATSSQTASQASHSQIYIPQESAEPLQKSQMKRDESLIPITSAAPVGQQDNEKDTVKVSPGTTRTHSAPSFITQVTQSTQPVYIRPVIDPSAKKVPSPTITITPPSPPPPLKKNSFMTETHNSSDSGTVPLTDLSRTPTGQSGLPHTIQAENDLSGKSYLLPPASPEDYNRKCLVLDLDETLLHSSFKPVQRCDFTIMVEIDNIQHTVYVLKRPFVEEFLEAVSKHYELVIFTASLSKYADPVLDILDPKKLIKHRLFRESCTYLKGNYIKDLELLGRSLPSTIIIDNSPTCYMLQPSNAVPIASWFDDPEDRELLDLIPFLEDLNLVEDVREILGSALSVPLTPLTPASTPFNSGI